MSQHRLFSEDEFPFSPESPLSKLDREEQIKAMKEWFFEHYTDPVDNSPYIGSEGGYQYIWGGPYDAREELENEFGGSVPEDVIEELADELNDITSEWTGNPDEHALDDYEFEVPPTTAHRASFDEAITIVKAILNTEFPKHFSQSLWRQQYAAVFFALEAFLFDFFYSTIQGDKALFSRFVKVNKEFQNTKFSLSDIVEQHAKLEQTVREYLAGLLWHNLPRISPLYKLVLGITFDKNLVGTLSKAVLTRHDIVHRNGKRTDGQEIVLSKEQVIELISCVGEFVKHIEEQWIMQGQKGNDF